jgi:hypothetical protein
MRLNDLLKRNTEHDDLPRAAGGAPLPGERLEQASRYMDRPEAEAAEQMIRSWRELSPAEYDAFASSL